MPTTTELNLRHHGDADAAPGLLDFAVNVRLSAPPRWLNEAPNRARVLAITEAQPRHGGSGALYVLIRRQRE